MELVQLPLYSLFSHPKNANQCDGPTLKKLETNIRRTGKYPPLIARQMRDGRWQLLDGHHRLEVLKRLKHETATVMPWDATDAEADLLLATLNELRGKPLKEKRKALLHDLAGALDLPTLAALVPEDDGKLVELLRDIPAVPVDLSEGEKATEITFRLYPAQREVVDRAISAVCAELEGANREGRALELVCADFLAGS